MAQDYQRQPRVPQRPEMEQSTLVEALSAALLQEAQYRQPQEDAQQEDGLSIDMAELFFRILSKIHFVILAALVATLLAGLYARYERVPVYKATSKLYIVNNSGLQVSVSDLQIASVLTSDYQEIFTNWVVHEKVIQKLGLQNMSYSKLQSMISVFNPDSTRLLYISATHPDPQMAMDLANAYAQAAQEFIYTVMESEEPNEFAPALLPTTPEGMSTTSYMIMGFMLGAILAVAIIGLQFLLDDRPHTPDDITKMAGIPTLAVMPREQNAEKSRRRAAKSRKEGKS